MIKFRCSACQKAIGVDEEYAGRLIRCPGCQSATKVPGATESEPPVAQVASPAGSSTEKAMEATLPHVPKPTHPTCPSCNAELFNPSDTMCGICGHLLEQAPIASVAPVTPRPASGASSKAIPVAATADVPVAVNADAPLLVNPALASPYAKPQHSPEDYESDSKQYEYSDSGNGRFVGAWFAAVGIGLFLALIWGVIASFMGTGAQAFGWAIGAIVGLIAGLVARNSSAKFCIATTGGALLCMLFGRLVSAWVIMLAVSAMSTASQFGQFLIPDTGVTVGVMEDMSNNGELEGEEKILADMKVDAFFTNKDLYDLPEYDDIDYETELSVDKKVREFVREMTDEEKQAVLTRVREDHRGWMEDSWHFEAILDSMVANDEIDDEGLLAHATAKLKKLDGASVTDYYQETAPKDIETRDQELQELVMNRYAQMDTEQRKAAIKSARLNHLSWTPVRHEFLAMLDAMYESGDIPKELKKRAKSTINLELSQEYDYAVEGDESNIDYEAIEKENLELQALVNEELLQLEQNEIDQLVASTEKKYPVWEPATGMEILDDFSEELDDQIARFESDGTFWSSLKTRFKTLDFVWLTLGMISAYAIAFTLGQSGKKKS